MPHLFYCLDSPPYTWTHLHRDPGPISSVLLACLGRNIQTFAEVPVMKCCPPSGQVVASLEISGVRVQVYKGADQATLQALLQAAKPC